MTDITIGWHLIGNLPKGAIVEARIGKRHVIVRIEDDNVHGKTRKVSSNTHAPHGMTEQIMSGGRSVLIASKIEVDFFNEFMARLP